MCLVYTFVLKWMTQPSSTCSELLWLQPFIPFASPAFYVQLLFLIDVYIYRVGVSETVVFYSHHTDSLFFLFFLKLKTAEKNQTSLATKQKNNWETLETLSSKSSHEQLLVFLTKEFYHPGTKGRLGVGF